MWLLIGAISVLMIAASSAYSVWQLAQDAGQLNDAAGVPLGIAGLVSAVAALRRQIEGNDAELARGGAATLAAQVEAGESAVWRQLLGDDTRRINLSYVLWPAALRPATAPAAGRLTTDGSGLVALPDIVTYYRLVRPLRLVVTGAAGAGKTVLALELMLALLDSRNEGDPVPVRIPLSRWDTERQSLPELLQQRLIEAYDWPADLAAGLVRHGLVLPVLDGLDEMDPLRPDGTPDPAAPRATSVIRALNAYQQGREAGPLILTCRTLHYDALAAHTEVLDAARIAVAPVNAVDARAYLTDRALGAARWQGLLDHLAAYPGGNLAVVLSTPWRLCLTATVYHHEGDPAELVNLPDADALDRHLLARYIPAVTRTAPSPRGYTPDDVHRWLHHLTIHLDPTGTLNSDVPASAEATDLVLHELWPLAGRTRVRTTDALLASLVVATPLCPLWITAQLVTRAGQFAAATSILVPLTGAVAITTAAPAQLHNPFSTSLGRKVLALGFAPALALVLFGRLALESTHGIVYGTLFGIALECYLVAAIGRTWKLGTSRQARDAIRGDGYTGLTIGLASGLMMGAMGWLLGGSTMGTVFGFAGGLAVGLGVGARAARRYAVFLLCSRRRLPFRLGLFLDWAVTAGLMRYSGPAYQYRHREFQHWLRQHSHPPSAP
ncbi:NACHT domain-containing protein [Streptomyces sp. NPDC001083]|uniref:NACHT domain-containing protein n=1 Tax=Streptomyces sp. NPDC001083 TaxID=3364545 RepID=UPI00368674D2